MFNRKFACDALALTCAVILIFSTEAAQSSNSYPSRPVKLVVAFPPGQATDVIARILAEELHNTWKQPVVVVNYPGGNSIPGTLAGRNAVADGYTITLATSSSIAVNPGIYKNLPYSPKDFAMVHGIFTVPIVIVTNPATPYETLASVVDTARKQPNKLVWGYGSTSMQLASEMFRLRANINILGVPYKGSSQAMTDLIGGQIPLLLDTPTSALPQIKAGKIKALAIMTAERVPQLPDVPTVAELGYPKFEASGWGGLVVPKATPTNIIHKISTDIHAILQSPDLQKKIVNGGMIPDLRESKEWTEFVHEEIRKWSAIASKAKIKAD